MTEVIVKEYWLIKKKAGIKAGIDECNSRFEDPINLIV
jgi:hypothetical protein